jgi:hypothetical protein
MFWAQADDSADEADPEAGEATDASELTLTLPKPFFDMPPHGTTKH